jgi:hypothetical protein
MFTKSKFLKKLVWNIFFIVSVFLSLQGKSLAVDTPYVINGVCISRVLSFSAVTARPENGVQVNPSQGYVNIYVPVGSTFSYATQDVSGKLLSSPNQKFYYDYRASTLIPAMYQSYEFAGNTNYLSLGTASVFQDLNFTCNGGEGTVLGGASILPTFSASVTLEIPNYDISSASSLVVGNGYYRKSSSVTLSVPHVSGYIFDQFYGTCNLQSVQKKNYSTSLTYTYNISNITSNCVLKAKYVKIEQVFNVLYHNVNISSGYDDGGTVSLAGNTGAYVNLSVRHGDTVSFSANATSGYAFTSWSGDLTGYDSSGSLQVNSDISASANFTLSTNYSSGQGGSTCASTTASVHYLSSPVGSAVFQYSVDGNTYSDGDFSLSGTDINNQVSHGVSDVCTNGYLVTPKPYSGYEFRGWSADSNVATSTLAYLNSYNKILTKTLANNVTYNLTANYVYTGVANDNGEVATEISEPSYSISNDTVAKLFNLENRGVLSKSPYTIDTKCVNRVLFLTGTRVYNTGIFGLYINASLTPKNYRIYTLDGSTVSQNVNGKVLTIKSSPSNLIFSYDVNSLSSGDYQSNNTDIFTGQETSLSFKDFTISSVDSNQFSCTNDGVSRQSLSFINSAGVRILQGFSYDSPVGVFLTNVSIDQSPTSIVNGIFNSPPSNVNPFDRHVFNASFYSAVDCTIAYNEVLPVDSDLGCPVWLADNTLYLKDYKYMWVISSKPVKNFLHEQEDSKFNIWDFPNFSFFSTTTIRKIMAYSPIKQAVVATGTLEHPFYVGSSSLDVNFYATKIDLSKCVLYPYVSDYANGLGSFVGRLFSNNTCPKIQKERYLNHLVFDSEKADTPVVFVYGLYMTSSEEDLTTYSANKISTDVLYTSILSDTVVDEEIVGGANIDDTENVNNKIYKEGSSNVPAFKGDTYTAPDSVYLFNKTGYVKGYSSVLSKLTEDIKKDYSFEKCADFGYTTGLLQGFGCVLENLSMQILSKLFIPSSNDISALYDFIMGTSTSSSTSFVTVFLSIPLRFNNWSNLDWLPNSTSSVFASSYFIPRAGYYDYTATTTIDSYYIATSTTPGFYTQNYHATSTGNATSTGGTITTASGKWIHKFTSDGTFTPNVSMNVESLVVGGGGGGGGGDGGGGGAGSAIYTSSSAVTGQAYSITVGQGGSSGITGSNSIFSSITANGGGLGSTYGGANGGSGGNGGGAAYGKTAGTSNQGGYSGGGYGNYGGGGGGGAGGAGGSGGSNGGDGGAGYTSSISGSSVCYAGGGPGSGNNDGTHGTGTCGANGSGSVTANTGAGGRGRGSAGDSGASGVVIISYSTTATGTIPGYYTSDYTATSTTPGYWVESSVLPGFYTYVATSTTDGVFASISTTTYSSGYLTIGFSSSTKYEIKPITLEKYEEFYESSDRIFADYLELFLSFFLVMYASYRAYKLIIL